MTVADNFRGAAISGFVLFGILWLTFALTSGPDHLGIFVAVCFSSLSVVTLGLPLIRKITLTEEGLRCRSPWTGVTQIAWRNVEAVAYRRWALAKLQIRGASGQTINVPWYLNGMQQLRSELERRVRRGITDEAFKRYRAYLTLPDNSLEHSRDR